MRLRILATALYLSLFAVPSIVSAQTAGIETPVPELPAQATSGTRYFLSTNIINLALLDVNIAAEIRFRNKFALKTSIFGGTPLFMNDYAYGNRNKRSSINSIFGLHIEPRWYVNRSRSAYVGASVNLIGWSHWEGGKYDRPGGDTFIEYYPRRYSGSTLISGVNATAGYYLRITPRFGMDFGGGFGALYLGGFSFLPFGEVCVSISWELGRHLPPMPEKRTKRNRQ